jgi:DNA-directed RNA polymerase specialized sigma54-like protein
MARSIAADFLVRVIDWKREQMTNKTHKENDLKNQVETLLVNNQLSNKEKQLFQTALNALNEDIYYNRIVFNLKNELSSLILQGSASEPVLKFMSELSRVEPTSGPSSIWNWLIKR